VEAEVMAGVTGRIDRDQVTGVRRHAVAVGERARHALDARGSPQIRAHLCGERPGTGCVIAVTVGDDPDDRLRVGDRFPERAHVGVQRRPGVDHGGRAVPDQIRARALQGEGPAVARCDDAGLGAHAFLL
jgi:hypothetical protein